MENGRCRLHGGKSTGAPKGTQNALKLGMYASILRDDELDLDLQIGNVEQELHICRVQLRRCVQAHEEWDQMEQTATAEEIENAGTLEEVTTDEGERPFGKDADILPFSGKRKVRKRPNFEHRENTLIGRIESLEKTRKELGSNTDDDIRDAASKFRDAITEMDDTVPVMPDSVVDASDKPDDSSAS